jgi:DNA polymerase-1
MNCDLCPLSTLVKSVRLDSAGNSESSFFIVFDRPGFYEERTGEPFQGDPAKLLLKILNKAGLKYPTDVYLTYAYKCFCKKDENVEARKESVKVCPSAWLNKEILAHKPKIVVTLGMEATQALLPKSSSILRMRGAFYDCEIEGHKFSVMPTLSPGFLLQDKNAEKESFVIADIKRAFNSVTNGITAWTDEKLKTLNYRTVNTLADFDEMIAEVKERGVFAIDTETRGKDPYLFNKPDNYFPLVSIQISTKEESAWFLPIAHVDFAGKNITSDFWDGIAWSKREFDYIKASLKEILESKDLISIGHNFKFDSKWMMQYLGIRSVLKFDTMLAHGLFEETSNSLKKIAWSLTSMGGYEETQTKYTNSLPEDKQWDMFFYPMEQLAAYGCCDADVTFRVYNIFNKKLSLDPTQLELFKLLIRVSNTFSDIEHNGIKINTEYLKKLEFELDLESNALYEQFVSYASKEIVEIEEELSLEAIGKSGKVLKNKPTYFNLDSPTDVAKLFFEKLKIPIDSDYISKKTEKPSVGRAVLEKLQHEYPIAKTLLEYRKVAKQKSGFVDAYPKFIDKNDRIHSTFSLIKYYDDDADKSSGAATGRISSSNPNLQQIPSRDETKRIKKLFIPDYPSHYLGDLDFSGIELRMAAIYSKDPEMIKFFNSGKGDFHRYVASKIYKKPEADVTKLERSKAKSTTFGILYQAGPNKIAEQAGCSLEEAQEFITDYFKLFPYLKKWIAKQKADAQRNLYVKSFFGRIRQLPNANASNGVLRETALRIAVNAPIQADASDLTLYSLARISDYLAKFPHANPSEPTQLKAAVHDSILLSVHIDDMEEIIKHIKFNILEKPKLDFITSSGVSFQSEASVGPNWGEQTDIDFGE